MVNKKFTDAVFRAVYAYVMQIRTEEKRQIIDVTDQVAERMQGRSGAVLVFAQHTTAAVTTADLDPGTAEDFLEFLEKITPYADWRHAHDPEHAPDHLLASLLGPSVVVPVREGELQLGTWQRIVLVELDGPRTREVCVKVMREEA